LRAERTDTTKSEDNERKEGRKEEGDAERNERSGKYAGKTAKCVLYSYVYVMFA
jgi:hypothetical protein